MGATLYLDIWYVSFELQLFQCALMIDDQKPASYNSKPVGSRKRNSPKSHSLQMPCVKWLGT